MKLTSITFFIVLLCGCAVSPAQQKKSRYEKDIADSAYEQAISHGELHGTPDNLNGIDDSWERFHEYDRRSSNSGMTLLERAFWKILFDKL